MISMMQGMYRSAIAGLIINWQGMPQESVSVPAGRFDGCFKTRTEAQYGTFKSTADSWSHPAVPLSGAVRSQGVDHQFTMELAASGPAARSANSKRRSHLFEPAGSCGMRLECPRAFRPSSPWPRQLFSPPS